MRGARLTPLVLAALAAGCAPRATLVAPSRPWGPLPPQGLPSGASREGPVDLGRASPGGLDPVPLVRIGDPAGLAIADRAEALLAEDGRLLRSDCSGVVETVFQQLGLPLPELELEANKVAREFRAFQQLGELHPEGALPGDLAFFDDTYDRNQNGRRDDPLTHVAIVTRVDDDGTLTLVHYGGSGLAHFRMNLERPHLGLLHGHRYNDRLRVQRRRDPPHTPYLAAELWAGFGRLPAHPGSLAWLR